MKKISLKNIDLSEIGQLSREQLKNVLGGIGGGSTSTTSPWDDPITTTECGDTGISCICHRESGDFSAGCTVDSFQCRSLCGEN